VEAIPGTIIRGMGGDRTAVLVGRCARCNRKVYGWKEENNSADPRGYFGPRNTVTHLVASEMTGEHVGPDVVFCWDCVNEHGSEGYAECVKLAVTFWDRFQDSCDGGGRSFCEHGPAARLETGGGSGLYLCPPCWAHEMEWRKERNRELDPSCMFAIREYPTPRHPMGKELAR